MQITFLFFKKDKISTKGVKITIERTGKRLHSVYGNAF